MNTKTKISVLILMGFLAVTSCGKKETAPADQTETTEPSTEGEQAPVAAATEENVLVIEGNDQMQFSVNELKAVAGKPIKLTLKHVGKIPKEAMGHNLVILQEGTDQAAFALKANDAKATDYIPESEKASIIAHTKLIGGGEEDTIEFTIDKKGSYPFICSFPGHVAMMKGVLIVE
ncbi:MAG: azurin [Flavobacterium nitrogenifigens]|uniref:Azurin n=1 Tax=Flavobacterium nitrogenifigens TaxID=1617283 RepID=A0A521AS37_9FLAO|nr:azurin [Flavobacterium nitrogenifigens]KAF2329291.1 azurin [Flavobacterium nitrogenifigens]MDQ8011989.1 azurin [Flavobacterium nitrogenifigens]SMO37644.1 azurin [Flavobacterium nitrogenifigens]